MNNKGIEALFDLMIHRHDNGDADFNYAGVTLDKKMQSKFIHKGIQAYVSKVRNAIELPHGGAKQIQAFTTSGDLPILTKDVFNVTNEVKNYDILWQEAFKPITLRKGQLNWEIATVANGIAFEEIPEAGKIKYREYSGSKITAGVRKYGAAVGITWETIEGRKLYQFIDQMEHVRSELYGIWKEIHYALLAAAGVADTTAVAQAEGFAADYLRVAWAGTATDSDLDRDIDTINTGYQRVGDVTKDRGFGDTANAGMLLYASPNLKARIMQALRATNVYSKTSSGAASSAGQQVLYNVKPLFSWDDNIVANKALLVLPGNKIQNSMYMQELGLSKQDLESLNELRTYWTAFGAAIGDNDQVAQLSFS